jgi:hypothetical protein
MTSRYYQNCIYNHYVTIPYGVEVMERRDLPTHCSCGALFEYADEVAFVSMPTIFEADPEVMTVEPVGVLPALTFGRGPQ